MPISWKVGTNSEPIAERRPTASSKKGLARWDHLRLLAECLLNDLLDIWVNENDWGLSHSDHFSLVG
jgi:hypothetical protein